MHLSFDEKYYKEIDDTAKILPAVSSDFFGNFGLTCSKNKLMYVLSSSYGLGYKTSDLKVWEKAIDEMSISNSLKYCGDKMSLKLSQSMSSHFFTEIEDSVLYSSFLSPGTVTWSLGTEFSADGWVDGTFSLNFASAKFVLFVNQNIYDARNEKKINNVEIGKYFTAITGFNFDYSLSKEFNDELRVKNSGTLFFPGQESIFSKEWFEKFNVQLNNEISYSINSKFKFALQTKFEYNHDNNKTIELYNKLAIGIIIK